MRSNIREIGSFFETEDSYKNWFYDYTSEQISFTTWINSVGDKKAFYFESGRAALSAVIQEIEERGINKICLLPEYLCDTVIKPFTKRNWNVVYYHLNSDLSPDEGELRHLVQKHTPGVILTVLYYGRDTISDIRGYLKELRKGGVITIEDLTQSLFMFERPNDDDISNYRLASIRKWLPVSGGGIAFLKNEPRYEYSASEYISKQHEAQILKLKYLSGEVVDKDEFLFLHREAESILDNRYGCHPMDLDSYGILGVYDIASVKRRRYLNTRVLEKGIHNLKRIRALISYKENDDVPLYYPVIADDRDALQEYMRARNVFLPVLWPVPKELGGDISCKIKNIYDNMLAIPCDQRYEEEDMILIINMLHEYEE